MAAVRSVRSSVARKTFRRKRLRACAEADVPRTTRGRWPMMSKKKKKKKKFFFFFFYDVARGGIGSLRAPC
eukprot:3072232-Prymnesium_polylepis.2